MEKGQGRWTRMLRRGVALFLTTVTVWVLSLTADMGAAAETFRTLAESPAFVSAALRAELGNLPEEESGLTGWQKLVLGQSSTLSAGLGAGDGTEEDQPSAQPAGEPDDPEDPEELPEVTAAPEDIVGRTLLPTSGEGYDGAQGVYIENRPGLDLDVAALAQAQLTLDLPEEGPQVLIVHTHGSEAYTPDGTDTYVATGECRTTDTEKSVVRVGDEIAKVLTEMGLTVVHDTGLYDYPEYNGAYDRPSRWCWTSTGTPSSAPTAPSTSPSPPSTGRSAPRSCWSWAPTPSTTTRAGWRTWPWRCRSRRR